MTSLPTFNFRRFPKWRTGARSPLSAPRTTLRRIFVAVTVAATTVLTSPVAPAGEPAPVRPPRRAGAPSFPGVHPAGDVPPVGRVAPGIYVPAIVGNVEPAVLPEAGGTAGPCTASTYGWGEPLNRHTYSGDVFDPEAMTAASPDLPMGTVLDVFYGGETVRVRVNDLGPARRLGRCLDLSRGAWRALGLGTPGLVDVTFREVTP